MTGKRKILAVDDNEVNLAVVEELLGDDYELDTATSGEEALAAMEERCPDVVLLDIMMPGIDGYETCRRIRANPKLQHVIVVLVSAKAMPNERLEGYAAGADDYVTKPFDGDELEAKVRVYLRLCSAESVDRMKSDLLSMIAHEIRTPLTGMVPAGEILQNEPQMDDEQRRMWGEIVTLSARRLLSLADRGLMLCAWRTEGVELARERQDLAAILDDAIDAVAADARVRRIALRRMAVDSVMLSADREQLATSLIAMLEAAVGMSAPDSEVRVVSQLDDDEAVVQIQGDGLRLEEGSADLLFDALNPQAESSTAVRSDLGMTLARTVARAHGGDVRATVDGDGEATFELRLPASVSLAVG